MGQKITQFEKVAILGVETRMYDCFIFIDR